MKKIVVILGMITAAMQAQAGDKPNVVLILSDDQGWGDYGFMGHPHIRTPNLDQLAGEGLLYERGYTTAAICRPSLASIVTGLYPHQTAVRGNGPFMGEDVDHKRMRKDEKLWPLAREKSKAMTATLAHAPSMVKQLRDNGYATLQTGKWWEENALDHGFTEGMTQGGHAGDRGLQIGRKTMQPIYDFVNKAQDAAQPFFIWYAPFLPHIPHNAPHRLYLKYKELAPDESTARYWANIAWLDETCGQLVDYLKEKDLYDNTLFVFTADNGWRPDPQKVSWYVRSKKEPVEAGVRTPIFLTHKKRISPHRDKETLASNIDIAPTILKACGIEPDKAMSGLDLRKPEALARRDRVFVDLYEVNIRVDAVGDVDSDLVARVVVDGWDKLIVRPRSHELYDLKDDPDDRRDISAQNPDKVQELSTSINDWLEATPVIFPNATRHVGAEETDRQALPPIQFVEGDTRFTAANQQRVDLVRQIPGLVALWDFVHRRDSWQTHNPFISIPGNSGGRTYELEPRNISLDFWHQGPQATLADFELLGRGPFGQAVRFSTPRSKAHLPVLAVPRKSLHDSPLDIKGKGHSVTLVVWLLYERGTHAIAGMWHEGTVTPKGEPPKVKEPGKRQFGLFAGLQANKGGIGAHISENGGASFGDIYARHLASAPTKMKKIQPDTKPTDSDSFWNAVGMVFHNEENRVTAYVNGLAEEVWVENPKTSRFFQHAWRAWQQGQLAVLDGIQPGEDVTFPKDQFYQPVEKLTWLPLERIVSFADGMIREEQ